MTNVVSGGSKRRFSLDCDITSDCLKGVLVVVTFLGTLMKGLADNANEKQVA